MDEPPDEGSAVARREASDAPVGAHRVVLFVGGEASQESAWFEGDVLPEPIDIPVGARIAVATRGEHYVMGGQSPVFRMAVRLTDLSTVFPWDRRREVFGQS